MKKSWFTKVLLKDILIIAKLNKVLNKVEVQFMDEGILSVIDSLAAMGKRVICAGLDNDFRGEPFSIMPQLLCMAEYVTKLTAICNVCGASATRTQRIVNGKPAFYEDPTIIIGASESYEPRCRHCHVVPHKNHE